MKQAIFQEAFIKSFVSVFRRYNKTPYEVSLFGLSLFSDNHSSEVTSIIKQLKEQDISVVLLDGSESVSSVEIVCKSTLDNSSFTTVYMVQSLPTLLKESSDTGIPAVCLIIMKCIARVICKLKVLYKAIALDLDDTLWNGILSEIGAEQIKKNLSSGAGATFISFMAYVKALAEELGIFVAICSRNDEGQVISTIEQLDESIFPLKHQIDCIIANNNDKSQNLVQIANHLSILSDAIVFIDDNKLVRDEIRKQLPEVYVPEWDSHAELISLLTTGCCFERNELSVKSQLRRRQFSLIQSERSKNARPSLHIKDVEDNDHVNASELYAKSNQFNFSQHNQEYSKDSKSVYFELFRDGGESLGICSTLTYRMSSEVCYIINWAMSCRFFEIGVEEFVLLFIKQLSGLRKTVIFYNDSGLNFKVKELLSRFQEHFAPGRYDGGLEIVYTPDWEDVLLEQTNLHND